MCGMVGMFDSRGRRAFDKALLVRMTDTLYHRGPDGDGYYLGPGVALGHRRLAIIDLAGGVQPMFSEDGTIGVIFVGEIYNFQELRRELESAGYRFRTRSDTEVIVHGWCAWGPECVKRFRGMFTIAVWDEPAETLFLARDRLGKKPLYYSELADGTVVFASELKALLPHPGLVREIDPQAAEDYLALGYVPDPKSIFRGVRKLPPAHMMVWRRGQQAEPVPYWAPSFKPGGHRDIVEAADDLRARLEDCVRARLVADVPLGAFLSGGVDSSGVVAMMAGGSGGGGGKHAVNTFCIAFNHPDFDESGYARRVAERYGTNHRERSVDPDSFDLVDRLSGIYDEPFGDSSAMPTFRVCELARRHVTVALSGDGGDELFAGYRRYPWHLRGEALRRCLPAAVRGPVFGALGRLYPAMAWAPRPLRARTFFRELSMDAAGAYFNSVSQIGDGLRDSLYSPRMKHELQGYHASDVIRGHMAAAGTDDPLLQAQYTDLKTWLPGDILVKMDRASMANSLEVRAPMLDHTFVEWAGGLDPRLKLDGSNGKKILKKALEPLVPEDLLYRPKQGFSIPIADWFRGPLKDRIRDAMTGSAMAETGLFRMDRLRQLVDQHQSGRYDHGAVLWNLSMFEAFLRNGTA